MIIINVLKIMKYIYCMSFFNIVFIYSNNFLDSQNIAKYINP